MSMRRLAVIAALALSACISSAPPPVTPGDQFFSNLSALCGKRFAGRLASNEPADASFAGKALVMGTVDCTAPGVIRIPLAVGEDRSRTWVVTRISAERLRLKHDHRHADGTEDVLTQYGGDTATPGTMTRQEFPVDEFSKSLFTRENRTVSLTNVWAVELKPGETFAYELNRANRHFRVEFDTSKPL
jgi:hypothetical protein